MSASASPSSTLRFCDAIAIRPQRGAQGEGVLRAFPPGGLKLLGDPRAGVQDDVPQSITWTLAAVVAIMIAVCQVRLGWANTSSRL